ncbi:MAG: hypothetical protein LBL56_08105 [Treponema sp.]|jgi:hypothetical protein|nr:hypothetical protein [Treponema sp.]
MGRRTAGGIHLVVLVPHRDSRKILRERSAELFAAGFWGAWSFPQVSPLALLSAPMTGTELKGLARRLRELSLAGGRDGMLRPGTEGALPLPGLAAGIAVYGPRLDIDLSPGDLSRGAEEKLVELFPQALVGCAILGPEDPREGPLCFPAPENKAAARTGFRAAAVANLLYRPIPAGEVTAEEVTMDKPAADRPPVNSVFWEYSYSWRIGKLYWLPPCPRKPSLGGTCCTVS